MSLAWRRGPCEQNFRMLWVESGEVPNVWPSTVALLGVEEERSLGRDEAG